MAKITLKGNPVNTMGNLPEVGKAAPAFTLVAKDLSDVSLSSFSGQKLVLNIHPSLDTSVCAMSLRRFNADAAGLGNTVVLSISVDLPFAQGRFCAAEGIDRVMTLSAFRNPDFGRAYGVTMTDGLMRGLFSRAVVVVDSTGKVAYTEQVPEIAQEPNYEAALEAVKKAR